MTELQRRALARLPMSEAAVEAAYNRLYRPQDDPVPFLAGVRALCESHERLRSELQGLQVLYDDASRDADRLSAEVARLRKRLQQIASADWLLAGDLRTLANAALTETDPADASPTKGGAA